MSITFPIYSNPKHVTPKLFVNGSEINNNAKYVVNKEGVLEKFNLTITIVDLEEGDFADYLLDVTNFIGTAEVNFTVTAESKFNFLSCILLAYPLSKYLESN